MREFLRQRNVYDAYCIVTVSHDIIDLKKCCKSVSRTVAISWCTLHIYFVIQSTQVYETLCPQGKKRIKSNKNCLFNILVVIQLIKTLMKMNWVPFVELESRLPPALLAGRELVINKLIITHLPSGILFFISKKMYRWINFISFRTGSL